jgi:hypothetical protein
VMAVVSEGGVIKLTCQHLLRNGRLGWPLNNRACSNDNLL